MQEKLSAQATDRLLARLIEYLWGVNLLQKMESSKIQIPLLCLNDKLKLISTVLFVDK